MDLTPTAIVLPAMQPPIKVKSKKKKMRVVVRRYRGRFSRDPVAQAWRIWNHDFDTLLHELVKNEALADVEPHELVARAAKFADAIADEQNRRRPPTLEREDDWR